MTNKRTALAQQLEQARLDKQTAVERSDAWYDADSRIESISRELYAGQPSLEWVGGEEDGDEDDGISFLVIR